MAYLPAVRRIIEEHKAIRRHIQQAGETVSDRESLAALSDAKSGWVPARLDMLLEKRGTLRETMARLADGLRNHFGYEEEFLPPLLGRYLMRALLLDHEFIKKELTRAERTLADMDLNGPSREQILTQEINVQQLVNNTSNVIEDHARREEVLLNMLERALEKEE